MSNAAYNGPIDGLKQSAVKGAFFTSLAQIAKVIVQFGSVIALSRLLSPADFGLLAMVAPLYGLTLIFQDLGLGHATVQSAQVTAAQSSALFWINVAASLCLAVPIIFAAPAVGWFYGDERVVALTRAFAVVIVVGALGTQQSALLNRSIRFRFLAALDTTATLAGFLGAVLLAALFHTYWALFVAVAISTTVSVVGAWIGTGFVPRLPRRGSGAGRMVRLGVGIASHNVFAFLARNLDNVLIGRVWGDVPLGLYDRAYKLLLFPLTSDQRPAGPSDAADAGSSADRWAALLLRLSAGGEPALARNTTWHCVCDRNCRHLCPNPTGERLARGSADLPVARSCSIATAD